MKKLMLISILSLCLHGYSFAVVTIVDSEGKIPASKSPTVSKETKQKKFTKEKNVFKKKTVTKRKKSSYKIKTPTRRVEQLHIDGYIDGEYVRLVINLDKNKKFTGYIFEHGNSQMYIYGEKRNGMFHIYDERGRYLNVIFSK